MKKILLATACFALMLSSCVKNFESESVTAMRDAQTALLLSQAKVNEAEAAAKTLLAEADAAIKKAQAEAMAVEAAIREVQKQLLEVELEAAKADLELKLAELEAKKAELAAQMEEAAVLAEQALIDAKNALESSKETYLNTLAGVEAAKAARLALLFSNYTDAVEALINAKSGVITATTRLVGVEKALVSAEEYRDKVLAEEDENIAEANRQVALYEQAIAYVEAYKDADAQELQAEMDELSVKAVDLRLAGEVASDDYNKAAEELDLNAPEEHPYYAFLSENPLGLYEVELIDGVAWYGFSVVENDDPLTATVEKEFYPVYVCYDYEDWNEDYTEKVQFGYNLFAEEEVEVKATYPEDANYEVATYYYELVGLGEYNAENVAKLAAYNKELQEGYLNYIEQSKANLAEIEAMTPLFKGAAEKAQAWAEAQAVYDALVQDTTEEQYADLDLGDYVKTTYGKYVEADKAYNGGVGYDRWGWEIVIEGTNDKYNNAVDNAANLEEAYEDAKTATEEAEEALEAAEEALKNAPADATVEEKTALAVAVETAKGDLEAAKAAEAEALRAWNYAKDEEAVAKRLNEAAKAEFDAAKAALDAQLEKVEPARLAAEEAKHAYDLYYDEFASNLGVEKYTGEWVMNYETWEEDYVEVSASATFETWTNQYEGNMDYVADIKSSIERSEAEYEAAVAFADEDAEAFLATAEELAAGVEDYVAEYNAAQKALADLEVAADFAWYAYDLNVEAYDALEARLAGIESLDDQIAGYEDAIEDLKNAIKASEENKETVSNLATQEQAIEDAKTRLELAQANVEFCQARADAAKAAWEAAEQE